MMQVKEAISERADSVGVAISMWDILKEKECTGKLNNTKRPERSQKTTKADCLC